MHGGNVRENLDAMRVHVNAVTLLPSKRQDQDVEKDSHQAQYSRLPNAQVPR